jgi:predicted Zn-dependent protease with MMP-like domain
VSLRNRRRDYHHRLADWPALSPAAFDALVTEALDLLPAWALPYIERVAVVVEDEPPSGEDPDLLGLYTGASIFGEPDPTSLGTAPDVVSIFQGPHERMSRTRTELRRQVAETVLHEIAHHFGLEEEALESIGPLRTYRAPEP